MALLERINCVLDHIFHRNQWICEVGCALCCLITLPSVQSVGSWPAYIASDFQSLLVVARSPWWLIDSSAGFLWRFLWFGMIVDEWWRQICFSQIIRNFIIQLPNGKGRCAELCARNLLIEAPVWCGFASCHTNARIINFDGSASFCWIWVIINAEAS